MPYVSADLRPVGVSLIICDLCKINIPVSNSYVKCDACGVFFHLKCKGFTTNALINKLKQLDSWTCPDGCCRSNFNSNFNSRTRLQSAQSQELLDLKKQNPEIVTLLDCYFKKFDGILSEIRSSQQFLSDQFDTFRKDLERIGEENKSLKIEVDHLKNQHMSNTSTINNLEAEIDSIKQNELKANIIIHGLTLSANCDPVEIFNSISSTIGSNINSKDTSEIKIVTNKSNNSKFMIVKFHSPQLKEKFMNFKKSFKQLFTSQIGLNVSKDNQIIFMDDLTPFRRKLLAETKLRKANLNIKYIWVNQSNILVRKDDGSKIFCVSSKNDLLKLNILFKKPENTITETT